MSIPVLHHSGSSLPCISRLCLTLHLPISETQNNHLITSGIDLYFAWEISCGLQSVTPLHASLRYQVLTCLMPLSCCMASTKFQTSDHSRPPDKLSVDVQKLANWSLRLSHSKYYQYFRRKKSKELFVQMQKIWFFLPICTTFTQRLPPSPQPQAGFCNSQM